MEDTSYYQKAGFGVEPLVICALFPFCFGNVIKYLMRANFKGDRRRDLMKARSYLSILCNRPAEMAHVEHILKTEHIQMLLRGSSNKYITEIRKYKGINLAPYIISLIDKEIDVLDNAEQDTQLHYAQKDNEDNEQSD